jgi:hypothetical protein
MDRPPTLRSINRDLAYKLTTSQGLKRQVESSLTLRCVNRQPSRCLVIPTKKQPASTAKHVTSANRLTNGLSWLRAGGDMKRI